MKNQAAIVRPYDECEEGAEYLHALVGDVCALLIEADSWLTKSGADAAVGSETALVAIPAKLAALAASPV